MIALPTMRGLYSRGAGVLTPDQVADLLLWYDGDNSGSITESSGRVSQWSDLSGNDHHLTQGTSGNQPFTGFATINGLNAIRFVHTRPDFMEIVTAFAPNWNAAGATVFLVATKSTAGQNGSYVGKYETTNNNREWTWRHQDSTDDAGVTVGHGTSSFLSGGLVSYSTDPQIKIAIIGDGNIRIFDRDSSTPQDTTAAAVTINTGGSQRFAVGTRGTGAVFLVPISSDYGEIVVYLRALSDAERIGVARGLLNKWT